MSKFVNEPQLGFHYNNLSIVPRLSDIQPAMVNITTNITKTIKIPNPFIASPMDSVIGLDLAKLILKSESIAILPPHYGNKKLLEETIHILQEYATTTEGTLGLAISPNLQSIKELHHILNYKLQLVALDTLHQEPHLHVQALKYLKETYPNLQVISGNVVCAEDCQTLIDAGADAIRVGMTAASINNGLDLTGCGRSQGSAIYECSKVCKKNKVPLIADGGIKQISQVALALALGADSVMMGSMFASLLESNATTLNKEDGKSYKVYTGMSRSGLISNELIPEGDEKITRITGSYNDLLSNWCNTLKISISRSGCNSIKNFNENSTIEFFI